MENPGLKRHTSAEPFLIVRERRTATTNPIMPNPTTLVQDGYQDSVNDLYQTTREDVTTPPPLMGGSPTGMVPATNGESTPDRGTDLGAYRAGASATQVPGETRQHANPQAGTVHDVSQGPAMKNMDGTSPGYGQDSVNTAENVMAEQNRAADQRRIQTQKGVGGGTMENPAYDTAQDNIRERMQRRRAHPLFNQADLHGDDDMMEFEHAMGNQADPYTIEDPIQNAMWGPGSEIHHVDPRSPQYDSDYERGWQQSQKPYDGEGPSPLEEMDDANASHAGYDGYMDYAVGRNKHHLRAVRRLNLNEPDDLPDEHWDHPEHVASVSTQSTWDTNPAARRGEIVQSGGSEDDNLVNFVDPRHRPDENLMSGNHGDQPMIDFKPQYNPKDPEQVLDFGYGLPSGHTCETCYMRTGDEESPVGAQHDADYDHPYKPMMMEPGQRYSSVNPGLKRRAAQVPSDDPVYPYSGRVDPEDSTDLENLQSGDDSFRPHNPDVDRVMNHMQGLPDMTRNDPKLMQGVNDILDQYPDTEEGNRGAEALGMGLNTIFDSTNETKGMPREERLQRAKDAMDAHFETAQLTHKQHVKQLHDDWEARGGHKTGEPRPVERFSPRYTKPQQIVPDPSNPFPELESPITMVGKCEGCGKKLYDSADSSGDPRGALGDHTVGTIDAAEYSPRGDTSGDRRMHGPSALICPDCDQTQERRNRIEDKYMGHKAGDRTGGFHWQWQRQPDGSQKNVRVDYTHAKDRKGKWHEPGEQVGNCPECDQGITGFHRRQAGLQMQNQAGWSEMLRTAHHDPDQDIKDVMAIQGNHGNWDYDPYMHGMFNGMELVRSIHDRDEPRFRSAPKKWLSKDASALQVKDYDGVEGNNTHITRNEQGMIPLDWVRDMPGARREQPGEHRNYDDGPEWDEFKNHVAAGTHGYSSPIFITVDHGGQPVINEGNHRRDAYAELGATHVPAEIRYFGHAEREGTVGDRAPIRRVGSADESDEDFWARMEREHPGGQMSTRTFEPTSPDATGQQFVDGLDEDHDDPDLDDVMPDNMSLRDHAHLLRSGTYKWDGDTRYPKYTHLLHRNIVDSDGRPAFAEEGHVIEHNTSNHGPMLPSSTYEPHSTEYPWSHTYYPAGQSDHEGLTKGYNTVDQAMHAGTQLALWGARHPDSQEALKGYRYVGNEMPYDPSEVLPHEKAMAQR